MNNTPNIKETVFSISGDHYLIRPVRRSDFVIDLETCEALPNVSDKAILLGQKPSTSSVNLRGIYDFSIPDAMGFVASEKPSTDSDKTASIAGFALMVKNPTQHTHQFYLSVDPTHRLDRLAAELMTMLINYAKSHDIPTLFCVADEHNVDMRALAEKAHMSVRLESGKQHQVNYSLFLDQHPGIVSV